MASRTKTSTTRKAATASQATAAAPGKSATVRKTAAKADPAPAAAAADAAMPLGGTPEGDTARLRRGDLLDALADRSPTRRAELKVTMELMLEELGKLLDTTDELVVPPLGKLSVKKRVARSGGDMLTVKLKRMPRTGTAEADAGAPDGPASGTEDAA